MYCLKVYIKSKSIGNLNANNQLIYWLVVFKSYFFKGFVL